MANSPAYLKEIMAVQSTFKKYNTLDFTIEAHFATEACRKQPDLAQAAIDNPTGFSRAFLNVAACGISIDPVKGWAALLLRDGQIVLDITYKGLIYIATSSGDIKRVKAELVYKNDTFTYRGPFELPVHVADPFDTNRGNFIGVYCAAETRDGGWIVETMPASEVNKIRDRSIGFGDVESIWEVWFEQMAKKTVIKRASNTWPKTEGGRLETAIASINEHEGLREECLNGAASVPEKPEYDPQNISDRVKTFVTNIIKRAEETGGIEAAREVVKARLKGGDLSYASDQLDAKFVH